MRCPKCQYLSVDDASRCRNCGHTFAVTAGTSTDDALALRPNQPVGPMLDLELHGDALLGSDAEGASPEPLVPPPADTPPPSTGVAAAELPLFLEGSGRVEATRPIVPPARPPLSVRRPTTTPRPRPTPPNMWAGALDAGTGEGGAGIPAPAALPATLRHADIARDTRPGALPLEGGDTSAPRRETQSWQSSESSATASPHLDVAILSASGLPTDARMVAAEPSPTPSLSQAVRPGEAPPWGRRLGAALVDLAILALINGVVLSFTSRIVGLALLEFPRAALVPMGAFLLTLNYAYAFSLVAVSGQTLGKMAFGLKVVSVDGQEVDASGAALRALFAAVTVLLGGLPYLFALGDIYGRAPHDRVAGTRVVAL